MRSGFLHGHTLVRALFQLTDYSSLWIEAPLPSMPGVKPVTLHPSLHVSANHCGFCKCLVKGRVCSSHLWPSPANLMGWKIPQRPLSTFHLLIIWTQWLYGHHLNYLWFLQSPYLRITSCLRWGKFCDFSETGQLTRSPLYLPLQPYMTFSSWAGTGDLFSVLPIILPLHLPHCFVLVSFPLRIEKSDF